MHFSLFLAQPNELLDKIVGDVESPSDVLSFACTCKRILAIAIPAHLHYRQICVNTTSEEILI